MTFVKMLPEHWPQVLRIYEEGLATGMATFETIAPSWEQWDNNHLSTCRIVSKEGKVITGWAALSPVSSRCVYGGVAEVSVYVAQSHWGKGLGLQLLNALVDASEQEELWTLQSGIFAENKASIRIHEKAGFRTIGIRERIGQLQGVWRDTVLMERRSKNVGN